MTTTIISPFLEHRNINKNNKMFNYNNSLGGTQQKSVPFSSASLSSCDPTKVVGGLFLQRRSLSLHGAKVSQNHFVPSLKMDSLMLLGSSCRSNNKENHFHECSFSELRDRQQPIHQACVSGSQVNSSRYKTELCRPFEENGACRYGDKCQFAHGLHELRNLNRHPKYKTELCRTFHTIGFCPYGPRCHFIHNAEERRGPPPLSVFNKMERPRLQHSFSFAGFPTCNGLQDSPTSITPPPVFSTDDLTEWQDNPFTHSGQELNSVFGSSLGPPPVSDPHGQALPSLSTPCFFKPTSESPPSLPDSLSDQEGYQSSLGSQSGSDSPLLDASHRLPIFSRLSV